MRLTSLLAIVLPLVLAIANVNVPKLEAAAPAYRWHPCSIDRDQLLLFADGRQVGNYWITADVYRPLDPATRTFGEAAEPPIPPPGRNHGIRLDKIQAGQLTRRGMPITKAEALDKLGAPQLPEDADHPWLTIIGTEAECRAVLADVARVPELRQEAAGWRVKELRPSEWQARQPGYDLAGRPALYLQGPDGARWEQLDHYPGPAELSRLMAECRRLRGPAGLKSWLTWRYITDQLSRIRPAAWALVCGAILCLFSLRRSNAR